MIKDSSQLPDYIVEASQTLGRNIPRLRSVDMVLGDKDVHYLLRGILPQKGVAAIYGPPSSGKTFIALDLIFCMASDKKSWFFLPMKSSSAVYVALEGHGGIKRRIDAWQRYNRTSLGENVQVLDESFQLDDQSDVDSLAKEIVAILGKGSVVVIDTLAQAMAGFDENSSADMGAAIAGAQRLSHLIDGLVILIHHSGKDVKKGMRGHSSLLGAIDASIEVEFGPRGRSWKVRKSKDGEAGQEYAFDLVFCDLGLDVDGQSVGSCAVRQVVRSPSAELKPVIGCHRIVAIEKLRSVIAERKSPLSLDEGVKLVSGLLDVESKRQRTVARATVKGLVKSGHLDQQGDLISLPP